MGTLVHVFSHICGQMHCWTIAGQTLPLCQRCTGLYVSGLIGFFLFLFFRPRPTALALWINGIAMLLMIPFGYHLVPHSAAVRTLTGELFAFGLIYYLSLNPAIAIKCWERSDRGSGKGYWLAAVASLPLPLLAVTWGGAGTATVLAWIAFAGLIIYAVLVLANLVVLPLAAWRLLHRGAVSHP